MGKPGPKRGAPWHEEARKMRAEGATYQQIADRFGVTNPTAYVAINSEYAERHRKRNNDRARNRRQNDPEWRERRNQMAREWRARQKAATTTD